MLQLKILWWLFILFILKLFCMQNLSIFQTQSLKCVKRSFFKTVCGLSKKNWESYGVWKNRKYWFPLFGWNRVKIHHPNRPDLPPQYLSIRGGTSIQPQFVEMALLALPTVYLCCVPPLNFLVEGIRGLSQSPGCGAGAIMLYESVLKDWLI